MPEKQALPHQSDRSVLNPGTDWQPAGSMLRWVHQEDPEGCGLAVLAMLTGETYAKVKADVEAGPENSHRGDWTTEGITYYSLDRFLVARGFYLMRIYEGWGVSDWPPDPWAPVHFADVVQPSGNTHFVVMLSDGRVLDPLREGIFRLSDWEKVNNVVGCLCTYWSRTRS